MSRNPFELKIGRPLQASWEAGRHLDFDQSSIDPRFLKDSVEDEKIRLPVRRIIFLISIPLLLLGLQLARLQIVNHDKYLAMAEGNRLRTQPLPAPRGLILDAYGKTLAFNVPNFELAITPTDLPKDGRILQSEISELVSGLGIEREGLESVVAKADKNSFLPVTAEQSLTQEQVVLFSTKKEAYPGFSVIDGPRRSYVDGPVFSHIIGYTGKLTASEYDSLKSKNYLFNDIAGKDGVEMQYESILRGILGEKLVEVDAKAQVKTQFQQKNPVSGSDIALNIDSDLQKVLYDSLSNQLKRRGARKAAAVIIDPSNGAVLALVSLPGFDNNDFAKGVKPDEYMKLSTDSDRPVFNRVISGTYPPGSTVKPFIASAALQEGVITDKTKIVDEGKIVLPNPYNPGNPAVFRGWNLSGLGPMDVYSAIAMSSDIFFYTVGGGQKNTGVEGLGPDLISKYLADFYLGRITGIDLPSEKTGLVPDPKWKADTFAPDKSSQKWYLGDTYNFSIGQGFLHVTPLQMAVATAAIANGGKVYKPSLLKSGGGIASFKPQILNENFIDKKYIDIVRTGMRMTVTSGTAKLLGSLPITVAGKTGTSQFDSGDLTHTHAWFTAFAPYENPKLAMAIMIEAGGEGSGASVPVARDVLEWYSKHRAQ